MSLEIRAVSPEWQLPLAHFFGAINASSRRHFHPHPLTPEYAETLAHYAGKDLYYVLVDHGTILAYGILRGWDEGYAIPSLGIAVHPDARGQKLGEMFMHFLHTAARRSGAQNIRLKVYPENVPALHLYTRLGYKFGPLEENQQLLGTLDL